ncbi:MAG: efflux RND transporter periplasmic adaptor subunit [Verrucomicrobiota bacterium]|nr:efflux RND transporter periplasmic adaptor subunit [Verrucomicrobiota bacterium]
MSVTISNTDPLAVPLEVLAKMNHQTRFLALCMTLCNETAARFKATRVSLSWVTDRYLRVQAISHMDRFEKTMEAVKVLESLMEECRDQDDEILYPNTGATVTRFHEKYARMETVPYLLSIPLKVGPEIQGVLTLERERSFSETEIRTLRLLVDLVSRRLAEVRERDLSLTRRVKESLGGYFKKHFGPERTWEKAFAILGAILLITMLVPWPYKVSAPFTLRSTSLVHVPAPFDAFILEPKAVAGDAVKKDQVLAMLDDRDLKVMELEAIAEMSEHRSQANQAQLDNKLGEMWIASAPLEQARAKLQRIRYHMELTTVKAPFDGLVVSGDLREKIGAPIKKGDILFKVAQIENLYVEVRVSERDIHEIKEKALGKMAFTAQPGKRFSFAVDKIEPAAIVDEKSNVFIIRAHTLTGAEDWWRPGMTGTAKIRSGWRPIIWIVTHRSVDFLRMKLWI